MTEPNSSNEASPKNPSAEPTAQIDIGIGPLPICGRAYAPGLRLAAVGIFMAMLLQVYLVAQELPLEQISPLMAGITGFCILGMALIVYYMQISEVTIDEDGIRQTWIIKREVRWEQIQSVRFMPLLFGKRLMVLSTHGRYVMFQSGESRLSEAFAHLALRFRRK